MYYCNFYFFFFFYRNVLQKNINVISELSRHHNKINFSTPNMADLNFIRIRFHFINTKRRLKRAWRRVHRITAAWPAFALTVSKLLSLSCSVGLLIVQSVVPIQLTAARSVVCFQRSRVWCCRVPEQDYGVQPRVAAGGGAAAARRAAHHHLQPPLLLRRPRPLGSVYTHHHTEKPNRTAPSALVWPNQWHGAQAFAIARRQPLELARIG